VSASIICQGCGQPLEIPLGYTRRKLQCPGCGVMCELPARAAEEVLTSAPAARRAAPEPPPPPSPPPVAEPAQETRIAPAQEKDLVTCRHCGELVRLPARRSKQPVVCRCCGTPVPGTAIRRPAKKPAAPPMAIPVEPAEPPPKKEGVHCTFCNTFIEFRDGRRGKAVYCLTCGQMVPLVVAGSLEAATELKPLPDEDDGNPYDIAGGPPPHCPHCDREIAPGTEFCLCGFDLVAGEMPVKVYRDINRRWETGLAQSTRLAIFLGCQAVIVPLTLLGVLRHELEPQFLVWTGFGWLFGVLLLSFLLGTFDRIELWRNRDGKVRLTKTWRVCFLARSPTVIPVREYEELATGMEHDVGFMEWFIMLSLVVFFVVPGVLWWYYIILSDVFYVALRKDHGSTALRVYQGHNEDMMRDVAATLSEAAELPCEGV
jgi:hypothetical protein